MCAGVRADGLLLPSSIKEVDGKLWLLFPRGCCTTLDAYLASFPNGLKEAADIDMVSSPRATSCSPFRAPDLCC